MDSFRVLSAKEIERQGTALVQVEFDNPHPLPGAGEELVPIQNGTLFLDSKRSWSLRAGEFKCAYSDTKSIVTLEMDLAEFPGENPIPQRRLAKSVSRSLDGTVEYKRELRSEFELSVQTRLPADDDFKLSAFGLPEPVGMTGPRRSFWYLWTGGTGILCVVLAVAVARRRKGKARQGGIL